MSDKLLINLFGLMTINADGIYAIGAAIIIVLIVAMRRQRDHRR
ncbi:MULTISPECIES: hypothetical protein [Bradyrhizobium]|nr:hypothetical protein [Bradyrhizobium zhengyangense]